VPRRSGYRSEHWRGNGKVCATMKVMFRPCPICGCEMEQHYERPNGTRCRERRWPRFGSPTDAPSAARYCATSQAPTESCTDDRYAPIMLCSFCGLAQDPTEGEVVPVVVDFEVAVPRSRPAGW
jgi:hypothetical protein